MALRGDTNEWFGARNKSIHPLEHVCYKGAAEHAGAEGADCQAAGDPEEAQRPRLRAEDEADPHAEQEPRQAAQVHAGHHDAEAQGHQPARLRTRRR
eukprot:1051253-Pyramimonas_sp.AAC.1